MFSVSGLAKHYGDQTLFEGASLQFLPGERYGIVGANGCGKSTLLKIISGLESPSQGEINIPKRANLGVLKQDHFEYETNRILDVVMMGNKNLWDAMAEKETILANAENDFDGERYAELEDIILQGDGYTLEARAGEILEGLGIESEVHEQPLSTLSGGFKLRVLLAQVLASEPDVLLLDEPTNHLDILSIRWLERFLEQFRGAALMVSHDHRFLDNVATVIVDLDYSTAKAYPGNYQAFVRAKFEERNRREKEIEKREAQIADKKAFVERFRAKASKARQAQSKLKAIERIEIESLPQSSRRYPRFRFKQKRPSGRQVLELGDISKSYGEKRVLEDVGLTVMRGEKVAIIGPNGIGKSTLLKIAMGEVNPDAGGVEWGYETYPGYFAQDHKEQVGTHGQTIESWLGEFCPHQGIGYVKGQLAAVLFSGDESGKKLEALSGGEAARLIFARHVVESPNVLVLDEPTNHLDLESIEALVEALQEYDGSLIFVSHDRWFVSELATRIIEITPAGINDFPGTYEEYLARSGDDHLDSQAVLRQARASKKKKTSPNSGTDQKDRSSVPPQRQLKKLEPQLAELTDKIAGAEEKVEALNARFCEENYYRDTPPEENAALEAEQRMLMEEIRNSMAEWEVLEEQAEALRGQIEAKN
ncbi:MAG: ABC-F family ATP-binding cassette domain-containing protein [Myxococcota bacterium]|jgi:ATPase subunit of ABC transporter with duplicated ATPase domains|nr:ABC-F family ATP-binding cassette domain-containing protein [Myxococcota bacterium]